MVCAKWLGVVSEQQFLLLQHVCVLEPGSLLVFNIKL
jgi:hypothetical protein